MWHTLPRPQAAYHTSNASSWYYILHGYSLSYAGLAFCFGNGSSNDQCTAIQALLSMTLSTMQMHSLPCRAFPYTPSPHAPSLMRRASCAEPSFTRRALYHLPTKPVMEKQFSIPHPKTYVPQPPTNPATLAFYHLPSPHPLSFSFFSVWADLLHLNRSRYHIQPSYAT